jgi:hypothetical protein
MRRLSGYLAIASIFMSPNNVSHLPIALSSDASLSFGFEQQCLLVLIRE